ncbi:hypothetical protein PPL_10581 [Heterostelium album PN500]|uniref:Uncharacterized protein n=1 Tax=Heterostelium pallidum (strain ATCC 26659 / Pp 5 / PN500) TaxID=670386 RepID=D3BRH0_HETP5|nr:hypothetical protein PPL_10581 [Heterostelium album PN500]EFA76002.1 hypothetical protein PPL_10581 [Heterostelium album PN500]|eukprot:XP_020428136.1 hypothetical protein PPL_10581 [Heterostelium album PN500]
MDNKNNNNNNGIFIDLESSEHKKVCANDHTKSHAPHHCDHADEIKSLLNNLSLKIKSSSHEIESQNIDTISNVRDIVKLYLDQLNRFINIVDLYQHQYNQQQQQQQQQEANHDNDITSLMENAIIILNCYLLVIKELERFTDDKFNPLIYPTISHNYVIRTFEHESLEYKLQIWDTSCYHRFRSITTSYFKDAATIFIVYDVTDERS